MSQIQLGDVTLQRQGQTILDGISLEIERGQTLALLGPSGSGKSTLIRVLLGLDAPDGGSVRIRGREVSLAGRILEPPETRNLAVVFQDLALWPHRTVRGNLSFGLEARGVDPAEAAKRIDEMLERVQLGALAERRPAELSGGECQRVAIARALVLEPDALLLDEPLSNLDVALRQELLALFVELFAEREATVLFVTHDPSEAMALDTRVAVMEAGEITHDGALAGLAEGEQSKFVRAVCAALERG